MRTINNNEIISKDILLQNTMNIRPIYIYLDFTSLVYNTVEEIEEELNYILYEIILNKNDAKIFYDKTFELLNKYNKIIDREIINKDYNITLEYLNVLANNTRLILSKMLINKIKYFIKDTTKYLYISFDGIPTMSKIVEQRRRKVINYICEKIKIELCDKYKDNFNENRKFFEKNKISVDTSNVIIKENFMISLYKDIEELKLSSNITEIIVSLSDENGEGEKKIFIDIIKNNHQGEYLIFSPDADVIILSLITINKLTLSSIKICKCYQMDVIEIIDTNILRNNIITYVNKSINNINNIRIINDICFLITLLGNDFLPGLTCFKNKTNLTMIINTYIKYFLNKMKYITYEFNNTIKIDYNNFIDILYLFTKLEYKLIVEKYMMNNYKNAGYLEHIMNINNINDLLLDKFYYYINIFNKLIQIIHNNHNNTLFVIKDTINKLKLKKFIIKQILIIENSNKLEDITDNNINELFDNYINRLITEVKNKSYYNKLKLIPFRDSINDKYHMTNIMEDNIHPLIEITTYDKEIYKYYNKLDEYKTILGIKNNDLGIINITYYKNYYKITIDNYMEYNKQKYYSNNYIQDINNLCQNYITGLFWNFDFYFNKYNMINICTWSYKDNIAPFITDLYNYLIKSSIKDLDNIFNSVNNEYSELYVSTNKFISNLEHYIYITPQEYLKNNIPDKYNKLFENKLFPDLNEIVTDILNNKNILYSEKGVYLNKSIIKGLNNISYNEYIDCLSKL